MQSYNGFLYQSGMGKSNLSVKLLDSDFNKEYGDRTHSLIKFKINVKKKTRKFKNKSAQF